MKVLVRRMASGNVIFVDFRPLYRGLFARERWLAFRRRGTPAHRWRLPIGAPKQYLPRNIEDARQGVHYISFREACVAQLPFTDCCFAHRCGTAEHGCDAPP